jgi:hypothetical protein
VEVVWVSGAVSLLPLHPRVHRGRDLGNDERLVGRIRDLGAAGYHDRVIGAVRFGPCRADIAQRPSAEAFRSARRRDVPRTLAEKVRAAHGQVSFTEQLRRQGTIDGRWTSGGLPRLLHVRDGRLRRPIHDGRAPAPHHPTTGRSLIAHDPALIERLKTEAARG